MRLEVLDYMWEVWLPTRLSGVEEQKLVIKGADQIMTTVECLGHGGVIFSRGNPFRWTDAHSI